MKRGNVKINNPERFMGDHSIAPEKLRAAIKKATDEKKVFSKLESDFMVAVHKACNDKYGVELEEKVSRILKNFNKDSK